MIAHSRSEILGLRQLFVKAVFPFRRKPNNIRENPIIRLCFDVELGKLPG
jgi:hypothetical protein